jgi:hypothetical protein
LRTRAKSRWLPSEATVGMVLLACATVLALLVLTGAIKLGTAP